MRARLNRLWDKAAPVIVAVAVFVGVCGAAYGIYQQHVSTDRGASNQLILKEIVKTDKTLSAGAKRRTAEIAQLTEANKTLTQIFAAAGVEELNLLNYEVAICKAMPSCVAPVLTPIPPIDPPGVLSP